MRAERNAVWVFRGADGLRAGWGLLIFIALFLGLSLAAQYTVAKIRHKPFGAAARRAEAARTPASEAKGPRESTPRSMLTGEGSGFAVVLAATFLVGVIERRRFGVYGLGGVARGRQFGQGLLWGVVCLSGLVAVLHFAGYLPFDGRLLGGARAVRYGAIWAVGFTLVALLEETLLRGYVQYTLARGLAGIYGAVFGTRHRHALGFWTAAAILSFVFGLGHGSNPGESPIGLLAAGLAGLVFCLALYRTGSLWWALGFHASWDWAQSFLYGVADSGTMVRGHLFATHAVGRPLLSGGLTGPEGSLFVLPTLAVVVGIIVWTLRRTQQPGAELACPDEV